VDEFQKEWIPWLVVESNRTVVMEMVVSSPKEMAEKESGLEMVKEEMIDQG